MDFQVGKPSEDGTVRITVPATVAFNGKLFEKNVRELVKHFGCEFCHSGKDYRYVLAKDYIVSEKLELQPIRSHFFNVNADGAPVAMQADSPALRVGLSSEQGGDLEVVLNVIEKIRKNFGCAPCHSGLDIHFKGEIEQLTRLNF
ncbi:MAG: hypothetical protein ABW174_00150 [Flavitalea sp.]